MPSKSGSVKILNHASFAVVLARSRFALNRNIEIDAHTLERLLDLFQKANFDFVGLGECRDRILGKKAERRCVVITFDDGYLDNYEHAYPILAERRIPFAVYLASKFPERQMPTWWYALEDMVLAKDEISFRHDGTDHTFPCLSATDMEATFSKLHHLVMSAEDRETYDRLLELLFIDWDGEICSCKQALPMSWEQVAELAQDDLVEIGAHTMSHAPLTCQSDLDSRNEILQSKLDLEARIGSPVIHFAYPYGMHGGREREIVGAGFQTAVTTWPGNLHHAHASSLEALPRIAITDDTFKGDYLSLMTSGVRPFVENSFSKVMHFD